ncbi:MAG: hypothetical protein LBQ62_00080 [Candidatus Accumulibacter sp.]|nr:hypothetical protein [Accumulibacter sp.]
MTKDALARRAADIIDDMDEEIGEFLADAERGHHDEDERAEDTAGEYGAVLEAFLANARAANKGDAETVMSAVKNAVLALNALEERYGMLGRFMLFCADEEDGVTRGEKVRELIRLAAAEAGVGDGEEDPTGKWREKW